jgi:hypothetical protein
MPELLIFKAGKYPQGDWPKERVQKLVDAYDPVKSFEAPVVIGHKYYSQTDADQFAHGWVSGLRMDGAGKVYAVIDEFSADAKKAIAEKKLRYISVEILEFDRGDEGASPYLRAISLLGRDTPAVQGAKLPTLVSKNGYAVSEDKENGITAFTHKLGADDIAAFSIGEDGAGKKQNHHEEDYMNEELEKLKAQFAQQNAELKLAQERIAAFQKENGDLKNAGRKQEAEAFYSKLRDEGKLPPALFEKTAALDARLDEEARKEFRAVFSELQSTVDFSGKHAAAKDKAVATAGSASLTSKIRAFQAEKNFASFDEAAKAYYAANPRAFEGEGGGE